MKIESLNLKTNPKTVSFNSVSKKKIMVSNELNEETKLEKLYKIITMKRNQLKETLKT